ncbi:hypothetical protein C8Q76DRAFT_599273, partial [Earliella scabrosa]
MWLLSTSRAELHQFSSPEHVPGGYGILSHVWNGPEQSFQETQELQALCKNTGQNPRDLSSDKVRESCLLAERQGHQWIWNDTCCINKMSSTELSEAINSMFQYYSLANECYAYLQDVLEGSARTRGEDVEHAFRNSKWHTRGWTLQELVAPAHVLFFNQKWELLGSKVDMAEVLQDITRIPAKILRLEVSLEDISVATRMSWAADRETTRLEDEAYCLLGIFSINMPPLYGEGRRAFQRLQEEIMKNIPDTTLFSWGNTWNCSDSEYTAEMDGYLAKNHLRSYDSYLLAPAPSAFRKCGGIHQVTLSFKPNQSIASVSDYMSPSAGTNETTSGGIPSLSITPYGVRARLPVVTRLAYTVAVLGWAQGSTQQLGLILTQSPDSNDPQVPRYQIGLCNIAGSYRLASLGSEKDSVRLFGKMVPVTWKEVYLAHRPSPQSSNLKVVMRTAARRLANFGLHAPLRFVLSNLLQFLNDHGRLRPIPHTDPSQWTGEEPMSITFEVGYGGGWLTGFQLQFGRCSRNSTSGSGAHWARIIYGEDTKLSLERGTDNHSCSTDHVRDWPKCRKTFKVS